MNGREKSGGRGKGVGGRGGAGGEGGGRGPRGQGAAGVARGGGHTAFRLEWADFSLEPIDGVVEGPTADDVRAIVAHLGLSESGFVILHELDGSGKTRAFVQVGLAEAGEPEAGMVIERQNGSLERHFRLEEEFVSAARAVEVFGSFFAAPGSLEKKFAWEKIEVEG
ncbi:hypothetical protein BH11PLA1_BH11PLA1_14890 [soil metagenome]